MGESLSSGALTEATYLILMAVHKPRHGYAIMKFIQNLTNNRVNLGTGTLYGALNILTGKGWIEIHTNNIQNNKKQYIITEAGKESALLELKRLHSLYQLGLQTIEEAET
ncbi:PadR family transcriptional regulator [Paenibacillus sp. FSL H8-0122]|uniref:PadR family transcriptional regulator n=1 Tax=Paenibacillus sp. FSL H8-0122 TaxID=2954510 RepID=UPI0030F69BC5